MAFSQSSKVERFKYLLKIAFLHLKPQCCFCHEPLNSDTFYPKKTGKHLDEITVHHVDHQRTNNDINNLQFSHRGCHKKYHIRFKKNVQTLARQITHIGCPLTIGENF